MSLSENGAMKSLARVVIAFLLMFFVSRAAATECRDDPQVIEQCVTVHGRIRVSASLLIELWPIGTKRLLQVPYATEGLWNRYLPPNVRDKLTPYNEVFGDFEICPFEHDQPGVMRSVCIESGSRLVVREPRAIDKP